MENERKRNLIEKTKAFKKGASDLSVTLPIITAGYLIQMADYDFLIKNAEKLSANFFLIVIALGTFLVGLAGFVKEGTRETIKRKKILLWHYILSVGAFLILNLNFYFIASKEVGKVSLLLHYLVLELLFVILINRKIKLLNLLLLK
ncbi:hypothetical protein [Bacillus wiedmannii]|uniref:hypothetical protein n=1 Tax=Bacillus wiedmannii TaxID=1890302 RepID=UPI000BFCF314|nr:hypothetical protein [Bacillus wiedmannii]PHD29910.1 hypothetical protein COF58_01025 [Bacillus wiedmannii]